MPGSGPVQEWTYNVLFGFIFGVAPAVLTAPVQAGAREILDRSILLYLATTGAWTILKVSSIVPVHPIHRIVKPAYSMIGLVCMVAGLLLYPSDGELIARALGSQLLFEISFVGLSWLLGLGASFSAHGSHELSLAADRATNHKIAELVEVVNSHASVLQSAKTAINQVEANEGLSKSATLELVDQRVKALNQDKLTAQQIQLEQLDGFMKDVDRRIAGIHEETNRYLRHHMLELSRHTRKQIKQVKSDVIDLRRASEPIENEGSGSETRDEGSR